MSWIIRVGNVGYERNKNRGVIPALECVVTSSACHTVAQLSLARSMERPQQGIHRVDASKASAIWQNVVSTLVEID